MTLARELLSLAALLASAATESGSAIGKTSGDQWAWGKFMDGFLGPAVVIVGLTVVVLLSLRMKKRNRDLAQLDRRPRSGASHQVMRESLERMAVDLEEVAREISAVLDTRMRALDRLIRDADERIARLEGADGGGQGPPPADDEGPPAEPAGPPAQSKARETLEHHAHIYSLADQGLSVPEIAEQTAYQRGEIELVLSLRKAAGWEEGS